MDAAKAPQARAPTPSPPHLLLDCSQLFECQQHRVTRGRTYCDRGRVCGETTNGYDNLAHYMVLIATLASTRGTAVLLRGPLVGLLNFFLQGRLSKTDSALWMRRR